MSSVTVTAEDYSQLNGKNVIITRGSTGIGEATVRLLHEHGATITLADINDTAGAAVAASLDRVTYVHCDVSSWGPLQIRVIARTNRHCIFQRWCKRTRHASRIGTLTHWRYVATYTSWSIRQPHRRPSNHQARTTLLATVRIQATSVHWFRRVLSRHATAVDIHGSKTRGARVDAVATVGCGGVGGYHGKYGCAVVHGYAHGGGAGAVVVGRSVNSPEGVAMVLVFAAVGKEWWEGGVNGE
ncbi:hypothetical protein BDD12DRAFT_889484 [Trichophaea hybrida]|nr:hypothetical protein BDD12DRAFT_889484 [Trichophaea hybrida]